MEKDFIFTQKIRAILFLVSVCLFMIGLPILLSFALGYKFNPHTFIFTRTGLLVLKTQPEGAEVYFEGKLLKDKTPLTIDELLPGAYSLELRLKDHYPWISRVSVASGKVASYDKIILFPLRPDIRQLNKQPISWFYVDREKDSVYYFDKSGVGYRSDLDGNDYEQVANILPMSPLLNYKLSPDRRKVLYFNRHKVGISFLKSSQDNSNPAKSFVLEMPRSEIRNVFWYSNNNYIILVTERTIEVMELRFGTKPIVLSKLNKKDSEIFYDNDTDTLYFQDWEKAADGKTYDNLYKLELKRKFFDSGLQGLLKSKIDE